MDTVDWFGPALTALLVLDTTGMVEGAVAIPDVGFEAGHPPPIELRLVVEAACGRDRPTAGMLVPPTATSMDWIDPARAGTPRLVPSGPTLAIRHLKGKASEEKTWKANSARASDETRDNNLT